MLNRQKDSFRASWAACFLAAEVALAVPLAYAEEAGRSDVEGAAQFSVPAELGFVVDSWRPAQPSAPVIVYLQEAHTNRSAQWHLVEILRRLIDQHGLQLILVEGGEGHVGLTRLRAYGTPEIRKGVVDKYLNAGMIGAEEYLDITTEVPLTLWGVERVELYDQQADAFLEAERLQAAAQAPLDEVRRAVEALKRAVFDPALLELDDHMAAFGAQELELGAYVEALSSLATRQGLGLEAVPNVARLIRLHGLEGGLEVQAVSAEHTKVISRLAGRLAPEELDALLERARQMKAGELAKERYYAQLAQTATTHEIDWSAYPNLSRYLTYLEERAAVNTAGVAEELPHLAQQLRGSLATDTDSQQLLALADEVEVVTGCAQLRLTSEEAQRLASLRTEDLASRWARTLNTLAERHGLPTGSFEGLEALQRALPAFRRFYEVARRRDEALAANAIDKVRASGERIAVLITGGFHSDRITRALRDQGFGVVLVAPRVDHPTDDRLYHAVLRYKEGLISSNEVFALTNR